MVCKFEVFVQGIMNALKDGWFSELSPPEIVSGWDGQALSLQVEEVLVRKKSDFQEVLVFKR